MFRSAVMARRRRRINEDIKGGQGWPPLTEVIRGNGPESGSKALMNPESESSPSSRRHFLIFREANFY